MSPHNKGYSNAIPQDRRLTFSANEDLYTDLNQANAAAGALRVDCLFGSSACTN